MTVSTPLEEEALLLTRIGGIPDAAAGTCASVVGSASIAEPGGGLSGRGGNPDNL
jgi:hypothetical protein